MDKTRIRQPVIQKHKDKQRPCNYHAGLKARELKKDFNKERSFKGGGHFDIMG